MDIYYISRFVMGFMHWLFAFVTLMAAAGLFLILKEVLRRAAIDDDD